MIFGPLKILSEIWQRVGWKTLVKAGVDGSNNSVFLGGGLVSFSSPISVVSQGEIFLIVSYHNNIIIIEPRSIVAIEEETASWNSLSILS